MTLWIHLGIPECNLAVFGGCHEIAPELICRAVFGQPALHDVPRRYRKVLGPSLAEVSRNPTRQFPARLPSRIQNLPGRPCHPNLFSIIGDPGVRLMDGFLVLDNSASLSLLSTSSSNFSSRSCRGALFLPTNNHFCILTSPQKVAKIAPTVSTRCRTEGRGGPGNFAERLKQLPGGLARGREMGREPAGAPSSSSLSIIMATS